MSKGVIAEWDDYLAAVDKWVAESEKPKAHNMDCPFCGQEIPADDFEWTDDAGGWNAICFLCEGEVMQ